MDDDYGDYEGHYGDYEGNRCMGCGYPIVDSETLCHFCNVALMGSSYSFFTITREVYGVQWQTEGF